MTTLIWFALIAAILRGHHTYPDETLPVVMQARPVAAA